jgi:prophage maintenance system killer protein
MMKRDVNNMTYKQDMVIYQTKSGALELRGDSEHETIWATQAQIVKLFGVDQSVVSRHVRNIFLDGEVDQKSNMQKMHIANSDKPVILYSLDVVLSIGYRTNSKIAIEFRQWATTTLRQHITKGFTLDKKRVAKHYEEFMQAVADVKALLPAGHNLPAESVLELVQLFADTWMSLDAYDKDALAPAKVTKRNVAFTAKQLAEDVQVLKRELQRKNEATENFAQERNVGALEGIVGNVLQSFGGIAVYPNVETKAAHLLYFIIKNHPFVDGNKRTGAYAFVWFLKRAKLLDDRLTPTALTALTILIAESNPNDKEKMIRLVTTLIAVPVKKKK